VGYLRKNSKQFRDLRGWMKMNTVKPVRVKSIKAVGNGRVVNLTVNKNHTFVTENGIATHNCDRLSDAAQKALRGITEDYSDRVRFIGTANYVNKIIPPLLSRFQHLDMDRIDADGVLDLVVSVVEGEELTFENEDDLLSHVDAYMPDMRKILNSIDNHTSSDGVIHPLRVKAQGTDVAAWEDAWDSSEQIVDSTVANMLSLTDGIDANNFEWYYECIYNNSSAFGDLEGQALVLCSKYLDRAYRCANQRLHMDAFLYEMLITMKDDI
jgi:DNA polymerase III delta prime subunit